MQIYNKQIIYTSSIILIQSKVAYYDKIYVHFPLVTAMVKMFMVFHRNSRKSLSKLSFMIVSATRIEETPLIEPASSHNHKLAAQKLGRNNR